MRTICDVSHLHVTRSVTFVRRGQIESARPHADAISSSQSIRPHTERQSCPASWPLSADVPLRLSTQINLGFYLAQPADQPCLPVDRKRQLRGSAVCERRASSAGAFIRATLLAACANRPRWGAVRDLRRRRRRYSSVTAPTDYPLISRDRSSKQTAPNDTRLNVRLSIGRRVGNKIP